MSDFHQELFDKLHYTPPIDAEAVGMLEEHEEDFEFRYPPAIRDWYSRAGAVEFLERGVSNESVVPLVNLIPDPVVTPTVSPQGSSGRRLLSSLDAGTAYETDPESYLPLVQNNRTETIWFARLNGDDDPEIWCGQIHVAVEQLLELESRFSAWVLERFEDQQSAHVKWLIERFPGEAFTFRLQAEIEKSNYNLSQAIEAISRAIELDPNNPADYVLRGKLYLNDEEDFEYVDSPDEAKPDFEKALTLGSQDPDAYSGLGLIAMVEEKPEVALGYYQQSVNAGTRNPLICRNLGTMLRERCRWEEAIRVYDRAIELEQYEEDYYANRGECRFECGDLDGAIADCNQALEENSYCNNAQWLRGRILMEQGKPEDAKAEFDSAINWNSEPVCLIDRALCLLELNDRAGAMQDYESVQEKEHLGQSTRARLAELEYELGEYTAARSNLEQVLERQPSHVHSRIFYGLTFYVEEDYQRAQQEIEHALEQDPESKMGLLNCAACCINLEKYDRAEECLNRLIELEPDSTQAYLSRAICWRQQENWEQAEADFLKFAELDPENPDPLVFIAEMYLSLNKPEVAAKYATEACARSAEDFTANYYLGLANCRTGNFADGYAKLEYAQRLSPESVPLLIRIAWLLATCPDEEIRDGLEALDIAELACDLSDNEDANALSILAAAHAELGEFPEAIEFQQQALEKCRPSEREQFQKELATYQNGQPYRSELSDY